MSRQFRSDDTNKWLEGYGKGTDGDLVISSNTSFAAAIAGCSGTNGSTALTLDLASTFANGDLVAILQMRGTGVGVWELNKISSGGGTTSLTLAYPLQNTYTDSGASQAMIVEMKEYFNVTINSGFSWSANAWDGNKNGIIAYFAKKKTSILGTLDLSAKGYVGGNGSNSINGGSAAQPFSGEGNLGTGSQTTANNGNAGGGGSGSDGGSGGGGGGYGTAGGNGLTGQGGVGTGGTSLGVADLTQIFLGGSGGGGRGESSANCVSSGTYRGGNGAKGGALLLAFSRDFVIDPSTGLVILNGANGEAGTGACEEGPGGGGAGSGAGGLVKAETASLGTNRMTSLGGSGGGSPGSASGDGGPGGVGRLHLDYGKSFTGSTNPGLDARLDPSLIMNEGGSFLYNFVN